MCLGVGVVLTLTKTQGASVTWLDHHSTNPSLNPDLASRLSKVLDCTNTIRNLEVGYMQHPESEEAVMAI